MSCVETDLALLYALIAFLVHLTIKLYKQPGLWRFAEFLFLFVYSFLFMHTKLFELDGTKMTKYYFIFIALCCYVFTFLVNKSAGDNKVLLISSVEIQKSSLQKSRSAPDFPTCCSRAIDVAAVFHNNILVGFGSQKIVTVARTSE